MERPLLESRGGNGSTGTWLAQHAPTEQLLSLPSSSSSVARIPAHAFANAIVSPTSAVTREIVITVPLPEVEGLNGDGRPKARRFRTRLLELGSRLRAFRRQHRLTQDEAARAIGVADKSSVSQWEAGLAVPDGLPRERLVDLLEGRL